MAEKIRVLHRAEAGYCSRCCGGGEPGVVRHAGGARPVDTTRRPDPMVGATPSIVSLRKVDPLYADGTVPVM